jgi:hypothetical protein
VLQRLLPRWRNDDVVVRLDSLLTARRAPRGGVVTFGDGGKR